ncbi:hypothetical protein ACHAXA_004865 [Cyclostephanos tholiformis]|uniref:protein acetyllysine N-acetyltransferase n=1 Tax=Cyclostephanos tholiformis TaxID=382380 RepID=A0ABD3R7T0_9STRA
MSAGYAQRLSEYPNKGICGLPETYDSQRVFAYKVDKLFRLIQQSQYTVVLTGAGISTSAGIPDFRGPSGIWTKEQRDRKRNKTKSTKKQTKTIQSSKSDELIERLEREKKIACPPQCSGFLESINNTRQPVVSFEAALPTYTHRALTHLIVQPPPRPHDSSSYSGDSSKNNCRNKTYIHHIITQNVDGLHRKTNLPRNNLSVLHGCKICDTCHTEYFRKFEIQSIGLKHTGRDCCMESCPGKLKDTLLDWENILPQTEWDRAQKECLRADLVLCLGTSLRIEPAGSLCALALANNASWSLSDVRAGGKKATGRKKNERSTKMKETKLGYAIVNLQPTRYDDGAAIVIHAKVDDVMRALMQKLGYGPWDESDFGEGITA